MKRTQPIGKSSGKSKTKMKVYNSREARKIIRKNGWKYSHSRGDHDYYKKDGKLMVIGCHLNRMIWERLVYENDINLNI